MSLRLTKDNANSIFENILIRIFQKNGNDFPHRFDFFAADITEELFQEVDYIEGNPGQFEEICQLNLGMEIKNSIKLERL